MLTPFDHEKQAALTNAARFLSRFTQRELAALDLRVGVLLDEVSRGELDNPFAIPYVLDALGSTSRAVYPNPRVWRPLMERLLVDLTPNFNGLYIALNGMLADHGVLPEIKATLRARSEHRPTDDRELLATFTQMLQEAEAPIPTDVVVPDMLPEPDAPPALSFDKRPPAAAVGDGARAAANGVGGHPGRPEGAGLDERAGRVAGRGNAGRRERRAMPGGAPVAAEGEFPSLDPLMALGSSTSLFATLAQWQKLDLRAAIAKLAPPPADGDAGAVVPLNLIPHIRAAVAAQMSNPADAISMDVIGLLFDYIFRDPTIGESTRALFGRLQVPIVKAALLDRSFFSDKKHPARQLLDHLADAAVGAANDDAYRAQFEAVAQEAIDRVCADFEIDVTVFRDADQQLRAFVGQGAPVVRGRARRATSPRRCTPRRTRPTAPPSARCFAISSPDRTFRSKSVRSSRRYGPTTWRRCARNTATDSEPWDAALITLDDTLWSIVTKERTAQKARLTKMIPSLIGRLRTGCKAMQVAPERSKTFFEALYALHMAAIKPPSPPPASAVSGAATAQRPARERMRRRRRDAASPPPINAHDYVGEMVVGTWLQFDLPEGVVDARLNWVSPLRAKYIFTSRSRSHAIMLTPEELAYRLGSGTARLVVEPVPLWDRAVSSALNTLAARKPPSGAGPAAAAPALA